MPPRWRCAATRSCRSTCSASSRPGALKRVVLGEDEGTLVHAESRWRRADMNIADIKKTAEQKMQKIARGAEGRPGQGAHRPRPHRPARPRPGRLLRHADAAQPGRQRDAGRCAHHRRAAVGEEDGRRSIEKAIRDSDLGLNPATAGRHDPRADAGADRGAPQGADQGGASTRPRTRKVAVRNVRRDANHAPQGTAQGQDDLRGRRAPRAGRGPEAHRPLHRRDRQAAARRRKPT